MEVAHVSNVTFGHGCDMLRASATSPSVNAEPESSYASHDRATISICIVPIEKSIPQPQVAAARQRQRGKGAPEHRWASKRPSRLNRLWFRHRRRQQRRALPPLSTCPGSTRHLYLS